MQKKTNRSDISQHFHIENVGYNIDITKFPSMLTPDYISEEAQRDLDLIRAEMKKENPDPSRVHALLCGDKYDEIDLMENV